MQYTPSPRTWLLGIGIGVALIGVSVRSDFPIWIIGVLVLGLSAAGWLGDLQAEQFVSHDVSADQNPP